LAALMATVVALFCTRPGLARQAFVSSTDLVVMHVNVKDRSGAFLSDLPPQAFSVFEDDRPQEVRLLVREDTPVTIGLLIDNSISMRETSELMIAAAADFARASHPGDEIFALAFNDNVGAVLPPEAPFTDDPVVLKRALGGAITAIGRTALFDALVSGLDYAGHGTHPRRVLVVVSDGGDNASTATLAEVTKLVQASNATIYTVTLSDPLDHDANPKRMAELAKLSGGEAFRPRDRRALADVLQGIARDIRQTYTLGYTPLRPPDGTWRQLRVVVTPPAGRRVVVRTRSGYLSPPAASHTSDEPR